MTLDGGVVVAIQQAKNASPDLGATATPVVTEK